MFKTMEVLNNPDGTATILFDLDEKEIELMESLLGVKSDNKIEFEEKFDNFVNTAITSYLEKVQK